MIIIHVNDTVKPKISKLSYTPNIYLFNVVYLKIFKIKSIFKQFTKRDNFNLQ